MAIFAAISFGASADARLIRLGPFDITPGLSLEGVYSSNIDGVRESEAKEQMEDFYLVYGFGLDVEANLTDSWLLESDFNVGLERHLQRTDLNSDSVDDLFGKFTVDNQVESGYYDLDLKGEYERTSEVDDDKFVSGSLQTRDPHAVFNGLLGLTWMRRQWTLGLEYLYERERHDEAVFQEGDFDGHTLSAGIKWSTHDRLALIYDYTKEKKNFLNVTDDLANDIWEETHLAGTEITLLTERPEFTYTVGFEKEDDLGKSGEWELIHVLNLSTEAELTRNLTLDAAATYTIEDNPESDDVAFVYEISLENEFSSDIKQRVGIRREPIATFNSSTDTDSTEISYELTKDNLLIQHIDFVFDVTYSRDDPVGEPTERSTRYHAGLSHELEINKKIGQILAYDYSLEEVDNEREGIEEHRVSLKYDYDF